LWLFRGIAVSLPFIVLSVAEIVMRCRGLGGYPAFLREAGKLPTGETVCIVEPAASKPYFYANPNRPGYAEQTNFLMPKPQGTVRIFLVGESAAKGYPQPRNLSMSAFLREILTTASPDRNFEIIDLGTTAVASFPLVYQVRDALRFSPDFFIFTRETTNFSELTAPALSTPPAPCRLLPHASCAAHADWPLCNHSILGCIAKRIPIKR
jgi:hypothetical protein